MRSVECFSGHGVMSGLLCCIQKKTNKVALGGGLVVDWSQFLVTLIAHHLRVATAAAEKAFWGGKGNGGVRDGPGRIHPLPSIIQFNSF